MIDFSAVQTLTIPEGAVKQITRNSDGVILWKKPLGYTNLAEPNDTNTTDWSIWCNNARMGSDGTYRAHATSMVTNIILINPNETIYFGGMQIPENGFTTAQVGAGDQMLYYHGLSDTSSVTQTTIHSIGAKSFAAFYAAYPTRIKYTVDSNGYVTSFSLGSVYNNINEGAHFRLALPNTIDKSKIIITKDKIT